MQNNTAIDGSLNCDKASQALLQYRNTPLQHLGLSPAQILFHRNLKDGIPTDPEALKPHRIWLDAAESREEAFHQRNNRLVERYNRHTRLLPVIKVGSHVILQDVNDRNKWKKTGIVVEQSGRKYTIRMNGSGRIVTRNRKHIRLNQQSHDCERNLYLTDPMASDEAEEAPNIPLSSSSELSRSVGGPGRMRRMLSNLRPYNNAGLLE